jgi:6-phosphofructokinase 1
MAQRQLRLGILAAGGPAPGINNVIITAMEECHRCGWEIIGFREGFRWLARESRLREGEHYQFLAEPEVKIFYNRGGCFLCTSRVNPSAQDFPRILNTMRRLRIEGLVTIGGDDTLYTAMRLSRAAQKSSTSKNFLVVHVPKTIDNDLPLPHGVPTFGFETARHYGAAFVRRLITDAASTGKHWHVVQTMGRSAGHLALGIGKAAEAHLTLIPEEFTRRVTLQHLCDIIETTVLKRLAAGKGYGVVVIAEGILTKFSLRDLSKVFGPEKIERDAFNNIRLAALDLPEVVCRELERRFSARAFRPTFVPLKVGYDVRSADPITPDQLHTRNLGYGAARAIMEGRGHLMVTLHHGSIYHIPFGKIPLLRSGRPRLRLVRINGSSYQAARAAMTRLEKEDFSPSRLAVLAGLAGISTREFRRKFLYLVQ